MKSNFRKLKRKLLLWTVLTLTIALIIGVLVLKYLIDGILQDPFADWFVSFCRRSLGMSMSEAVSLYGHLFRNLKMFWIVICFMAVLFIVFYFTLHRFTRYFNEIDVGLDRLLDERSNGSSAEIILSPEMEFMEKKLNTVKNTLIRRERAAKDAEQQKNDLVVYLAHDIRTPLTSVIAYLNLLHEAPDMPAEQRAKYVNITLDKAYRLEQLINEFFDITRFSLQTIVLNKEKINLYHMLLQMADEFYPLLVQRGQSIAVQADENLTVTADPDKLARVFHNILKNAAAYGDEGRVIEIAAYEEAGRIVITFCNFGRQIPENQLNTIFEKFYRLDAARGTDTGGAGLGLAIAKEIVTAHGGEIRADSGPEQTVFTVCLPA